MIRSGYGAFLGTVDVDRYGRCGRRLDRAGRPTYFITANTHYLMLTEENSDLDAINARAAFIVADGAPLIWASRWQGSPLPERVAGSDLIFVLAPRQPGRDIAYFSLEGPKASPRKRLDDSVCVTPGFRSLAPSAPPFVS